MIMGLYNFRPLAVLILAFRSFDVGQNSAHHVNFFSS